MKNKNIIILYFVLSFIFLTGVFLSFNNYSYTGYYTDKIIKWIWLTMTIFVIIWFWKKKVIKVYFTILAAGIVLSILPMMIPFFGIVLFFSTAGTKQRIQVDDTYRIERGRPGVMYNPQITVYRKEGILEKQISRKLYREIIEEVLQVSSENTVNEKELLIQEAKLIAATKDSIGIEYKIMNKKKVIYHKSKENWFDN